MPAVLWLISAAFSGAWIGNVVSDATKAPDVIVQQSTAEAENAITKRIAIYGALGLLAFYIFKKVKK